MEHPGTRDSEFRINCDRRTEHGNAEKAGREVPRGAPVEVTGRLTHGSAGRVGKRCGVNPVSDATVPCVTTVSGGSVEWPSATTLLR